MRKDSLKAFPGNTWRADLVLTKGGGLRVQQVWGSLFAGFD